MIFEQDFAIDKTPNRWTWAIVFLTSLAGLSYMGLNPSLIGEWWWVLVSYNAIACLVGSYYLFFAILKLKQDNKNNVVGARFTWSFVKIIPLLATVPVVTFYLFSFQTIQDNVKLSRQNFNKINDVFLTQINSLEKSANIVGYDRYIDATEMLLRQIQGYSNFQKKTKDYNNGMQVFIQGLVDKKYACSLELIDAKGEVIAKSTQTDVCVAKDNQSLATPNDRATQLLEVPAVISYLDKKGEQKSLKLIAIYAADPYLLGFLEQVNNFHNLAKKISFGTINTSITQKRFLLDFSSTVLLTVLSVLLIVFSLIDQLIRPMQNLSLATKEIAKGNYGVMVNSKEKNKDVRRLIEQFNEMSHQIQQSRQGLSTHNLYLETILKYSFGVIGLDQNKNIRFINPVVGKILAIKNERQFVGGLCNAIVEENKYLDPLFFIIQDRFEQGENEWSEEIEVVLPDRQILLSCQGAVLDVSDKTLGYVIIVQDISKLHRAQKKAAWGGVAVRMAHEIKNPLTPILLSAQRLRNKFLDKLKGKDLEIIDKTTTVIINQVESIDAMVSAFADYANIPQIERKLLDLNTLINQSVALYDAQGNIDIEFDLSGDVPELLLDASSISRVLINLVKNAIEAIDEDRDLTMKITTKYLKDERIVRLSIEDNGNGFDKTILESVFEPYVTSKVKGSGLGMAIVQNIIEQHDGRIFAGNLVPCGAIITIEFKISNK